jgi:hypothetical protein
MKVRIAIGDLDIRLDDVDMTHRQVTALIRYAVSAASTSPSEPEESKAAPIGFAATIERLPEDIPREDLDWYFDE